MTTARKLLLLVPDRLAAALRREAKRRGTTESDLVRKAVAKERGKPELAEMRGPGRPRKERQAGE